MMRSRLSASPKTRGYALVGGIIGCLLVVIVRFAADSPYEVFHRFNAGRLLPPMWLLGLLWFAFPVLCGLCAGWMLSCTHHAAEAEAAYWRGCTALVLSLMSGSSWYILLFGKSSLFFSGLCLLAAAALSFLCALSWRYLSVGGVLLTAANGLWYLLLFLMQTAVFLTT